MIDFSFDFYISELSRHRKVPRNELVDMAGNNDIAWEYAKKVNFDNEKEKLDYYSQPSLVPNYINWHFRQSLQKRTDIANMLSGKVLNYGCGIATESLMSAVRDEASVHHLFNLETPDKSFVNFLIKEHNISNARFVDKDIINKNKYDFIVSIDMLEHVRNPKDYLLWFKGLLTENGKLISRAPFNLDYDKSHIADHTLKLVELLKEAGYEEHQFKAVEV